MNKLVYVASVALLGAGLATAQQSTTPSTTQDQQTTQPSTTNQGNQGTSESQRPPAGSMSNDTEQQGTATEQTGTSSTDQSNSAKKHKHHKKSSETNSNTDNTNTAPSANGDNSGAEQK